MDADVIVAGSGMAGATLALGLAGGGLKVVLIDPAPLATRTAADFDGRASAISLAAFNQWRAVGAASQIEPHAQPIKQILVTDGRAPGAAAPSRRSAFLRFDSGGAEGANDSPLGYMVENRHIRAALGRAVADAGIECRTPAEVAGLDVGPAHATVTLADGRRLKAPVVAGADGRASATRRLAGIGARGWDYRQIGVVATIRLERPHGGVAHEYFLPSGPFAILPLTDQRASLVWTETLRAGAALRTASPSFFAAHLRRRFGEFLGTVNVEGPAFFHPLRLELAEGVIAPRVALLGDAAHAVHPIAGQGLNMGLKDVAALAQVVIEAVRLGEDPGSQGVLERYRRWRSVDNIGVALATDVFNRLFSTDAPLTRLGRDLVMTAVNRFGPARRLFMREAAGMGGELPTLLRGAPP